MQTVSYNLLTPKYAHKDHYIQAPEKALDPKYRFNLICQFLLKHVKEDAVLLLQEVSVGWACKLQVFFRTHGYIFITAHYDKKWSDYMGVAIAFPQEAKLKEMKREVISSRIKAGAPIESLPEWIYYSIRNKIGYQDERPSDIQTIVNKAKLRANATLAVKLEKDGKEFWFATYHFPCAFKTPLLMNLHGEACKDWLVQLEKDAPVIFGSDMNSQPNSEVYSIFSNYFKSSYKEKFGKEPESTNKVYTSWNYGFSGTLDYIWCSNKLKVDTMEEIPTLEEELPNLKEPSDHVPLIATFELE